jgi:hypothetical protein
VEATSRVVGSGTELAARVQFGEDHLHTRQAGARLDVHRDTAALVSH